MEPIIPFEPISTDKLPEGERWVAQVKWDGTRILAYFDGGELQLVNRRGNKRSIQYPELLNLPSLFDGDSFILDGEVIAFKDNVPSFYEVMKRDRLTQPTSIQQSQSVVPITYMVFDLLYYNGKWLNEHPLYERQNLLKKVLKPTNEVQIVDNFSDSQALYDAAVEKGLEGIVCKDINSGYVLGGKDGRWLKKKKEYDLIAIVGGVTYRGVTIRSLDLGVYNEAGELTYIGSAGSSKLTMKDWREVTIVIHQIHQENSSFHNYQGVFKHHMWVSPILKVKVTFLEWTKDGTMRQPVIQSFVF